MFNLLKYSIDGVWGSFFVFWFVFWFWFGVWVFDAGVEFAPLKGLSFPPYLNSSVLQKVVFFAHSKSQL